MKRVVLLGVPCESTNIVFNRLQESAIIQDVILEKPVSRWTILRRRAKKLGISRVLGQIAFQLMVVPFLKKKSLPRQRQIETELRLSTTPVPEAFVHRVESVNSLETIALLQRLEPDVIVINGTRIISQKVLSSVPSVFINMHAGITPLFRGVHGAYWALATGRRESCGVTVHLVDAGIDTGGILAQAVVDPTPQDNFVTYPLLQLGAGLPLLQSAVQRALDGALKPIPPPTGASALWSHPTLAQYLWNRLRRRVK
jgi:methionyl-tRNA formyltransferase